MPDSLLTRREFVKACGLVGAGAAVGSLGTISVLSAMKASPPSALAGPLHFPGDTTPVTVVDLDGASQRYLHLEFEGRPVVLFKVPVKVLEASSRLRGYNTGQYALAHPGDSASAILAYDGKCTHLGCTVGWNAELGASKDIEDYDGDKEGRILCPCHQAQFDIYDLARHMPATPAPRPLDALRIRLHPGDELWAMERIVQEHARSADRDGIGAAFRLASQS